MSKTYAIRKRSRGGIKGFQVVWFNLPTYFTNNGYAADEHDVKDGWFEYIDGAASLAHDLEHSQAWDEDEGSHTDEG